MNDCELKDLGWNKIKKQLKNFAKTELTIGLHEEQGIRSAQLALYQEYGTPRIPERPFQRFTFSTYLPKTKIKLSENLNAIYQGKEIFSELSKTGNWYRIQMKTVVKDWSDPPNAEATIERKGFNDPLLWGGQMYSAINYRVRRTV